MPTTSFLGHYDGKSVQLDEQVNIAANARVLVTVLPAVDPVVDDDTTRDDWDLLAATSLAQAYGDDEPEYTKADFLP